MTGDNYVVSFGSQGDLFAYPQEGPVFLAHASALPRNAAELETILKTKNLTDGKFPYLSLSDYKRLFA